MHVVDGPWAVAGDFNTVLFDYEKKGGGAFNHNKSLKMLSCMNACGLVDMGFKSPIFTWRRNELSERIDRVLCNHHWQGTFPNSTMINLPLSSSDHAGLWLRLNVGNGPPWGNYFKFLAPWLDHPDFPSQVRNAWRLGEDWKTNMERFTVNIKDWNKVVFGDIFQRKKRLIRRLEGINGKLLVENNDYLVHLRNNLWAEYVSTLQQEEAYWLHQARSKWIKLGDQNTRFFHQSTLARRRFNRIDALQNDRNEWVHDIDQIHNLTTNFFRRLFSSTGDHLCTLPTSSTFPALTEGELLMLGGGISPIEVRNALFGMANYKMKQNEI